ncbi:MAG: glycine-rich domain-containing protein [Bacteroidia bacterium]
MKQNELEVWQKIKDFELDEPGISYSFTDRLAKENNWKLAFALRAVNEYKKFIFLVAISPNPLSPPPIIDQVWHLHLLYTKSYWVDLCENILGKPIHHNPTKGGAEEKDKFAEWYNYTIAFYKEIFKTEPPQDIWSIYTKPKKSFSFIKLFYKAWKS